MYAMVKRVVINLLLGMYYYYKVASPVLIETHLHSCEFFVIDTSLPASFANAGYVQLIFNIKIMFLAGVLKIIAHSNRYAN